MSLLLLFRASDDGRREWRRVSMCESLFDLLRGCDVIRYR